MVRCEPSRRPTASGSVTARAGPTTSTLQPWLMASSTWSTSKATSVPTAALGAFSPMADLRETDDAYMVEAELPGIKREDIDVEISERELRISGEYKEREPEGVLRRSTRRTGSCEYRALLPAALKADELRATLTDGVLTVTVPKAQACAVQKCIAAAHRRSGGPRGDAGIMAG